MLSEDKKRELLSRIQINTNILVGKPIIRGYRISVEHILKAMAGGLTFEHLKEDYPFLEKEDIDACLLYAAQRIEEEKIYILNRA
jgi:uncharacterized protein (DUF433 family)